MAALKKRIKINHEKIHLIIPIIIMAFNVFLVLYPAEMVSAAKEGVQLWFNNVLPALLPFVIGANMLAALGFVHFLTALMSPVMMPLFNVSGAGGFALMTGLLSGYPMGAKTAAFLQETGQLEKEETQRLVSFSNNAGPLFVVGFVGTGLFGSASAGYCLLISHIAAAVGVGILFRFFWNVKGSIKTDKRLKPEQSVLRQAFENYNRFRVNNDCGLGIVMGKSVKNAMESMALIGGFIIFFCVAVKALELSGLIDIVSEHTPKPALAKGFIAGLLELTNGVKMIAKGNTPNPLTLSLTAALISFGGFSIHAQTAHFLKQADIRFTPYIIAKTLQACLSAVICFYSVRFYDFDTNAIMVFKDYHAANRITASLYNYFYFVGFVLILFSVAALTMLLHRAATNGTKHVRFILARFYGTIGKNNWK